MAESSPTSSQTAFVQQLNFWARDASNESAALLGAFALGLFEHLPDEGSSARVPGVARPAHRRHRARHPLRHRASVGLGFVRFDEGRGFSLPASSAFLRDPGFTARMREAHGWWLVFREAARGRPHRCARGVAGGVRDLLGWFRRAFLEPRAPAVSPAAADYEDRAARGFLRTQALVTSGRWACWMRSCPVPGRSRSWRRPPAPTPRRCAYCSGCSRPWASSGARARPSASPS